MNDDTRIWLQRRAAQAAPFEACGFILDNGDIVEIRNVATNPERSFHMDFHQMVEKLSGRDEYIAGIWHTHPKGTITPSHTDLHAIKIGAIKPDWDYWIVTTDGVYKYESNRFAPQEDSFWDDFVS